MQNATQINSSTVLLFDYKGLKLQTGIHGISPSLHTLLNNYMNINQKEDSFPPLNLDNLAYSCTEDKSDFTNLNLKMSPCFVISVQGDLKELCLYCS